MKKILGITFALLKTGLMIIVLVMLPLIVFTFVTAKTSLFATVRSYVVVSGSMEPTIPVGSIAFMMPFTDYDIGDVISFKRGNEVITHRIVQKMVKPTGTEYQTKGDANKQPDEQLVNEEQIIGKGVFQVLYAGRIFFFLKSPLGFITCIFLPTFSYIALEVHTIQQLTSRQTEQRLLQKLAKQPWPATA